MENSPPKTIIQKCPFMDLEKCYRQDLSRTLDKDLCTVCTLARSEKHMFDIKKSVARMQSLVETVLSNQLGSRQG